MMTPDRMATLHARAFDGAARAWSAAEFTELLSDRHVFSVCDDNGFALGRVIADEAELLTLATDPDHRRKGIARAIIQRFTEDCRARGAARAFLEVAADNGAALALYRDAGYEICGRRNGYYRRPDGSMVDAIILERLLDPEARV